MRNVQMDIVTINSTKVDNETFDERLEEKMDLTKFRVFVDNFRSLEEASNRTADAIQVRLSGIEDDLSSLNLTKVDRDIVNHQLQELEKKKVDQQEFEMLATNLSSLEETSSRTSAEIRVQLDTLQQHTQSNISSLNDTKANKDAVNHLFNQLNASKVTTTEFEELSDNFTLLEEESVREDKALRQELTQLAQTSHHNYTVLHEELDLKATQTALEHLSNTTVRTTTFNMAIHTVETTIIHLQQNATLNLTNINFTIQQISQTLSTKATKQQVDEIDGKVTTLETSMVDTSTYNRLATRVQDLERNKASSEALERLSKNVDKFKRETATKTSLNRLGDSVEGNKERIRDLEDGGPGLSGSRILVIGCITLILTVNFKLY